MATPLEIKYSRVGKRPVVLPKGVTASVGKSLVEIKGPKGSLKQEFGAEVTVHLESGNLSVKSDATGRNAARLQGLTRALLASMVKGVTEGYEKILELKGTGYRVENKSGTLHFSLGFSHPVVFPLPSGITATVPAETKGTVIILQGADKAVIGQTAAKIHDFRPPEPYGGKGVRYRGERVREKAGKAGKGGKK